MKTRKILTLFLITLLTATAALAQDKVQKIDALLKNYYDYGQLNGAVLVSENGKVIYKKGFGMANMEWEIPNSADTKFRIGSVTKQFTATLILQLVEEGKLKLDGKITDYLPDYRKDTGDKVTIHHLLNHTSGIPSYTGLPGFFQNESRNPYAVKDFVKKFASGDLEFEPGSKFSYNNSGYFLLGAIIEQVTGKSYARALQERIFDPVGMKDTGYDDDAPLIKKRATGYQKTPDGYENAPYLDMLLPYAAGSIYSTVEDLYKWDQALYDNKILSAASKELMFKPGLSNYGYGFNITDLPIGKTDQKTKIVGHSGGINGFNSHFTRAVEQKHLVVILDNVGLGRYHRTITASIINILNNQPYDEPKKSIAETLYKIAIEKGGAAAVAEYRCLKAGTSSGIYDFSEGELNTLGYQLLAKERTKDAIEIFKLNIEIFPAAPNPYDSLGEAYFKDGQKEPALAAYRKALELSPGNAGVIRAINRIEGKDTKVDPSVYDAYVGEYEIAPNLILSVTREGDKLMGQPSGQGKLELEPVSETQFTVTRVRASITFEKDAAGKVTGLIFVQGTRTTNAKKIK
jgi:CubicO group peptidase (beta-lactamase class C family)